MTKDEIAGQLAEARERTFALLDPVDDDDLTKQHDPLMSPIVWDLGHIAGFEELWLTKNLEGPVEFGEMPGLYNPFEHPRRVRGALVLPGRDECRAVMSDVRGRVLDRLARVDLACGDPLVRDGYVYNMVLQHEYQHNETMLQTLQLKQGRPYAAPRDAVPAGRTRESPSRATRDAGSVPRILPPPGSTVAFAGGRVTLGTDDRTAAYDNERPSYETTVAPFVVDVYPTTNADFLMFIRDGGYDRESLWTADGWAWRQSSEAVAPKYWTRDGDGWCTRTMDDVHDVRGSHPVVHVSYHEAAAFARFAGKRLPTEAEWEVAAGWNPETGRMQRFPWGDEPVTRDHANVDQGAFATAPVGAYDANWSPLGCSGMIGDAWEWTSSDFAAHPGYETFPYKEYSEIFFGPEYKVLRGGSWATRPGAIRNSFRNWDYPIRRQIFCGFRCARDG